MDASIQESYLRLKVLATAKARDTTLISILVPPNKALDLVTRMLIQELATSASIKTKTTRSAVQGALQSLIVTLQHCKLRTSGTNGLAVFAGQYI